MAPPLDFPSSPSTGTTYTGGNGVVYTWTGTVWLASGASAGGDFCANQTSSFPALPNTMSLLILTQVISGNSPVAYYSTSTGRYMPPAGRYQLYASLTANLSTGATHLYLQIRKNGSTTPLVVAHDTTGAAASSGNISASLIVDANGTDYFEMWGQSNIAGAATVEGMTFQAFPISGIKGPPGDPGMPGFRLLQRTVVSSAVATVDITGIASDINDLRFHFDLTPVTNAVGCYLQFFDSVGTIVSSGYYGSSVMSSSTSGLGGSPFISPMNGVTVIILNYNAAGQFVTTASGIRGSGSVVSIRDAAKPKHVDFQAGYTADGGGHSTVTGAAYRLAAGAITGLRFYFGSGNIASGAVSVWGSP